MGTTIQFKSILGACLLILFVSCNSNSSKKEKPTTVSDTSTTALPRDTLPPDDNIAPGQPVYKKCFENDGLKYKTTITIFSTSSEVTGTVECESLADSKKEIADFTGTLTDDKLNITFKTTPPVVGDASEWTKKSWAIKKEGDREILLIIFNAKNYNSNKWEETTYKFTSCK